MTKKEKYAEYGIEYRASDSKINSPMGWIPLLLPVGSNEKLGKAASWSIWHGCEFLDLSKCGKKVNAVMETAGLETIKGSCPCHCKDCYCDNGNYNFDSVRAGNVLKLIIARYCADFMVKAIIAQIHIEKIEQCRIHASGDFFSTEYVNAWLEIAKACDGCKFWTYTKENAALAKLEI